MRNEPGKQGLARSGAGLWARLRVRLEIVRDASMRPLTWAQLTATVLVSAVLACAASAQVASDPQAEAEAPTLRGDQVVINPQALPPLLPPVAVPQDPPPPAPPPPAGYVWNVIWTDETDPQAVRRLYPARAYRENVSGEALIECLVASDGALTECRVVRETPMGYGFGEASIAVARNFTVAPLTRDGRPTDGMRVRRNIRWAR